MIMPIATITPVLIYLIYFGLDGPLVNKICFRSEELKLTIITAAPKWPSLQSFKDTIIDDDKDTGYFVKEMWSFSHERNW